jgi:regulator of protease activity HflC (stomatin/prohibitin superfamily)
LIPVAENEAEAERRRAEGRADARRTEAEGEADAVRTEAQAQQDAYALLAELRNDPAYREYLESWAKVLCAQNANPDACQLVIVEGTAGINVNTGG